MVSVGSKILPAFEVNVVEGGNLNYSLPDNETPSWSTDNPKVATINKNTGFLQALAPGRTKVWSK